ncbi:putative kinesin [Trypanosoma cruzi]|nr:putative kinesin [Trypanosoma cruzi]
MQQTHSAAFNVIFSQWRRKPFLFPPNHDAFLAAPATMRVDGNTVRLNCPQPLRDAGFAVAEALFDVDVALDVPDSSTLFRKLCATAAPNFTQERKNMVAFSYGVCSSPKRQLMYGSAAGEGYAA